MLSNAKDACDIYPTKYQYKEKFPKVPNNRAIEIYQIIHVDLMVSMKITSSNQ